MLSILHMICLLCTIENCLGIWFSAGSPVSYLNSWSPTRSRCQRRKWAFFWRMRRNYSIPTINCRTFIFKCSMRSCAAKGSVPCWKMWAMHWTLPLPSLTCPGKSFPIRFLSRSTNPFGRRASRTAIVRRCLSSTSKMSNHSMVKKAETGLSFVIVLTIICFIFPIGLFSKANCMVTYSWFKEKERSIRFVIASCRSSRKLRQIWFWKNRTWMWYAAGSWRILWQTCSTGFPWSRFRRASTPRRYSFRSEYP